MYYLIGFLVTLIFLIALFTLFFNKSKGNLSELQPEIVPIPKEEECCGAHEVCESDSLLSKNLEITYYEDEELDVYRNMPADAYSTDEIEQFREVLYTLRENEVAGWLNSLRIREIELPELLRDEALLIVAERRTKI